MKSRIIIWIGAWIVAGSLVGDVDLFLSIDGRVQGADVVAIITIDRFTTSNAHAKVERVLKGKCPSEVTLPIDSRTGHPCGHFSLEWMSNCVIFLKFDGNSFKLMEVAPPIPNNDGSFSNSIKAIEMILQKQSTNSANKSQ